MEKENSVIVDLPAEIYKKTLNQVIEETFGFKDYSMTIGPGSFLGDNYMGVIYRVIVVDNETQKTRSIIVKVPPLNHARRKEFKARFCFIREVVVYEDIFTLFKEFQQSRNISRREGFYEHPKCYKALKIAPHEGFYFEDLRETGFEMFSRHDNLTFEHVKLVMEVLGKYHAVSFAIKDQEYEKIRQFTELKDMFADKRGDNKMYTYCQFLIEKALGSLDPQKHSHHIEKLTSLFGEGFLSLLLDCTDGKGHEETAVLCHGDVWNNNILFKYNKSIPVEIRLLDWQITRYASPVCDLTYYLFCCTHKKLRDDHYEEFLQIYHKSLSTLLRKLGSDPEKLFPYDKLKSELKRVGKFGLLMAIMLLHIMVTSSDETPDMDVLAERSLNEGIVDDMEFKSKATELKYKRRIKDVIIDIDSKGYI